MAAAASCALPIPGNPSVWTKPALGLRTLPCHPCQLGAPKAWAAGLSWGHVWSAKWRRRKPECPSLCAGQLHPFMSHSGRTQNSASHLPLSLSVRSWVRKEARLISRLTGLETIRFSISMNEPQVTPDVTGQHYIP